MPRSLMDDPVNRRIVAELLADGRVAHAELAERLGISRPTLVDRVRRLEAEGVIQGYAARVPSAAVGKPVMAFVSLRFSGVIDARLARLQEALAAERDVLEAHTVAGDDCLLLKVVAATPEGLNELLQRLRGVGLDASTRTTIVLETHFLKPGPLPLTGPEAKSGSTGRRR